MKPLLLTLFIPLISTLPITAQEEISEEITTPEVQAPAALLNKVTLNSKMLAEELEKADLVINATLSEINVLGVIENPLDPDVSPEAANSTAFYKGTLISNEIIENKREVLYKETLNVLWLDTATGDLQYSEKNLSGKVPRPITPKAFLKEDRIWFLKHDGNMLKLISDHPVLLAPHISEFLKTGAAKQLDKDYAAYQKQQNTPAPTKTETENDAESKSEAP